MRTTVKQNSKFIEFETPNRTSTSPTPRRDEKSEAEKKIQTDTGKFRMSGVEFGRTGIEISSKFKSTKNV